MNHNRPPLPFRACLALACLWLPATGLADFLDDDLWYAFESGSDTRVYVTGLKNQSATHIVIPSTVVYEWQEKDDDGQYQTRSRTCSVTSIRNSAFSGHSGLASVTIGNGVTSIGDSAFNGCYGLASVTIGNGVTSIGNSAFYGCYGLASVTIGNGVTSIGYAAFYGCRNLASVTIPDSVTSIGSSAFSDCSGLASVTIGNGVTSTGNYAFSSCSGLSSVIIGNSVTSIGSSAFSSCSSLASVTIPDSVTSIGSSAFSSCSSLASVTIPDSVTSIGSSAFSYCSSLASVTIGNGVTSIGSSAFSYCSSLASVTIGNGVTSIGNSAFNGCYGLASVTIPDSVTSIGQQAFYNCSSLATVTIGNGVTSIGNNAFGGCGSLTSFSLASGNRNYKSANGLLLTKDGTTLIRGVNGDVTIPDGVTNICAYAFNRCTDLTSVVIPDSVQLLANTAFDGCDKLWTSWYRTLANQAAGAGGSGGSGGGGSGGGGSSATRVSMTVTNIVLHYVTQSVPSGAVVPPLSSGLVNVVTEVGSGRAVAIPTEWAEQYPGFEAAFGSDFREAVTQPTGKRDGSGNPMFVWQDFVAGTDPTDESDVFTASITFDAATGEPVVSWSPELSAAEAAKRVYRIYGKVRLTDADWTLLDGNARDFNFFKVAVEMK